LHEPFEDPLAQLRWNTLSVVAHDNPRDAGMSSELDRDRPTARRVAQRVLDDVAEHLPEPNAIPGDDIVAAELAELEAEAVALGDRLLGLCDLAGECSQWYPAEVKPDAS
jgi:hypothetical protein